MVRKEDQMVADCESKIAEFKGHEEKLKARSTYLESEREQYRKEFDKLKRE